MNILLRRVPISLTLSLSTLLGDMFTMAWPCPYPDLATTAHLDILPDTQTYHCFGNGARSFQHWSLSQVELVSSQRARQQEFDTKLSTWVLSKTDDICAVLDLWAYFDVGISCIGQAQHQPGHIIEELTFWR